MEEDNDGLAHDSAVLMVFLIFVAEALLGVAVGAFFGIGWAALALLATVLAGIAYVARFRMKHIRHEKGLE